MNRIDAKFKELKAQGKKALIVYITCGYPDIATTEKLVLELEKRGVDIIELGVPFSDPLADGPIIQEASSYALKKKINLKDIFFLVKRLRRKSQIPLCLMGYYNPIFSFGQDRFVAEAINAGIDGVIIPDLPPEEDERLVSLAKRSGLKTIFFLSPTVCLCSTMYRIDPQHLCWALENLVEGNVVNQIVVSEEEKKWAKIALERMLAL